MTLMRTTACFGTATLAWILFMPAAVSLALADSPRPVLLIFDTDFCEDCDDVAALAMLHALQTRGLCQLLAVSVSADHPQAAPFVDCVNTFYGRPDIPIGVVRPRGVRPPSVYLQVSGKHEPTNTS